MRQNRYQSWGRYPAVAPEKVEPVLWRDAPPDLKTLAALVLPFGYGRSYGDSCLNSTLLDASYLNRFISFDEKQGLLRCEAGVSLSEILELFVPRGWFLPVVPGTKFVSVGGAIANDIHGKNHHRAGTFGCHVTRFELLRSTGERVICSAEENEELFEATIGGLGLTGLILWAEIQLKPIAGPYITSERIRFSNLEDFFKLANASDEDYEYTVAWVDCLAKGRNLGRGIFIRGNHSDLKPGKETPSKKRTRRIPFDFPQFVLNGISMKLFNRLYYYSQLRKKVEKTVSYEPFFFPLDSIEEWNRIYGKRGFLQYQCVVPPEQESKNIAAILSQVSAMREGSFLAVLKKFGDISSPGVLSFPRAGTTLTLDFPFKGGKTLRLLEELDKIVRACGGAVYPAKDARMSAESFQCYFPNWQKFAEFIDPKFGSRFWQRVTKPLNGSYNGENIDSGRDFGHRAGNHKAVRKGSV